MIRRFIQFYAPRATLYAIILCALMLFDGFLSRGLNEYFVGIITLAGINIVLAVSLNLVNGYAGQFSIGHAGFMALGAYTAALLSTKAFPALALELGLARAEEVQAGADPLMMAWLHRGGTAALASWVALAVALFLSGLVACVFGWIVGLPTLRLRGDYLAIATLGFSEIIRVLLLNLDYVGGASGFPGIPKLTTPFWSALAALVTVVVCKNLANSCHGRALLAIREDEEAAEAAGINTTWYKTQAFVIGAFFAGIAGGLFGHQFQFLAPRSFDILLSIMVIVMVVLGGMGSNTGSVVAAVILTALPEALRYVRELLPASLKAAGDPRLLVFSGLLVVLMLVRPQGLFGDREVSRRWLAQRGQRLREMLGREAR
jgi:branched-chain amino acid transport system permease protein